MLKLNEIRRVHIELTTRCNARCPMCMRNYRGYDYNSGYPDIELSLVDVKNILKPDFLAQLEYVNFNGNLGDFALSSAGLEIVEYLVANNVAVKINTNGSLRSPNWWKRLALTGVEIGFALDGLEDTHSLYRLDTDWKRIIENAAAFIKAGGQAVWRFAPFDHNRHQEQQCQQLARELGFVRFENIWDGRDTGPVFNRQGQFSHFLGKNKFKDGIVPPVKDLLHGHVTWFEIDKHSIPKDQLDIKYNCTHLKNKEIYIAADGTVYPCCYLGFYPDQMHHAGNTQIKEIAKENNALKYSLEHCLNWFDNVYKSWQQNSIANGRLYACVNNCGSLPN